MWLSYSRTVCFHGDCAAWVSSHIVSPSFVSSSYLEVFAKGGLIHLEYFPLLEGVVSLGKRETQKFRDVQLGSFPKFLPSVKLLLGEPTEINSSSLRKLQCSYSIKQEISRIADRYSWCAITFPSHVSKSCWTVDVFYIKAFRLDFLQMRKLLLVTAIYIATFATSLLHTSARLGKNWQR